VVCNACSPHRITIPYQYIVQPPELPRLSSQRYPPSYVGGDSTYGDFSNIGGGERVRLCNPCVPDPNITPPQPQQSPNPMSPRNHGRSQSNVSVGFGGGGPPPGFSSMFASGITQGQDPLSRHRSVTVRHVLQASLANSADCPQHSGPGFGTMASARAMHASAYNSGHGRILAGTPPSYFPATAAYPGAAARGFQSMLDIEASSSSGRERALPPPPPPPQLDEEDECPVCHRELPSRTLPNFEAVRETHITSCIMAHSAYVPGGTPTQGDDATPGAAPPFTMRLSGIFPYIATEKDCVDSAECTICLEEFEEGVEMARLECLCRFHLHCIKRWFKNHQGRCPVHQHDSFGY
jgi:RING finger family protein